MLLPVTILAGLVVAACGSPPDGARGPAGWDRDGHPHPARVPVDLALIPDAVPTAEPRSRYGNPAQYEVFGRIYRTNASSEGYEEKGLASWYGTKFHGRRTASGEIYDMFKMTAAHRHLPLPSHVEVTNLDNSKRVIVRVNDRGPFVDDRIIDLSYAAAHRLDMVDQGVARVHVRHVKPAGQKVGPAAAPSGSEAATAQRVVDRLHEAVRTDYRIVTD